MAARNLLSGEVLLRRVCDNPEDPPIGVELTVPPRDNPKRETVLSYTLRNWKRPRTVRIPVESSRFWTVLRGADDDVKRIREAGYALVDGRDD